MLRGSRTNARFNAVLIVIFAAWFLANVFLTVRLLVDWYSPLPLRDYWQNLAAYSSLHLSAFWRQQNEHRILFPELIFAADTLLLRGRMLLPLVLSGLCYLGVWGAFVWGAFSMPWRTVAGLFAGALMFWPACTAVLAAPFQLSFTLLQFSAAMSFVFLAKLHETKKSVYLAGLVTAAVVATYSLAGGLLLWPILILGAALLKVDKRRVGVIAIAALVSGGLYFLGYQSRGSLHVLPMLQHPGYLLGFVAAYLGMPFDSLFAGALSVAIFACCLRVAIRQRVWDARLGVVLFGTYSYTLLSALTTAAGRMEWTDPFFTAAKAPRYVTVPMAAWGALILAIVWLLPRRFTLLAAVAAFAGLLLEQEFIEKAAQDFSQLQISALMLKNNVTDDAILTTIFPSPEFVKHELPALIQKRLSVYAHGTDNWIGQDAKSLWPFAQPVPGQITKIYPVEGGLEIYGWSDSPFLRDEHAVLFVDQSGKIAGFGKRPGAGFPLGFGTWDTPPSLAFLGFVRVKPETKSLTAWVWAHPGKTLHRMGDPIVIANITVASQTGAPLPDVAWQMSKLRTYAFAVPPGHCIVLPVLHGPSAYGQSVRLINADSNETIASAPMFDGRSIWERWRISVPPDVSRVFVLAEDVGQGGNQWVEVGAPAQCP